MRVFQLLLALFPRPFRRQFGAEIKPHRFIVASAEGFGEVSFRQLKSFAG